MTTGHFSRSTAAAITERWQVALRAVAEVQPIIMRYFQSADLAVELKADKSPVTIADTLAEECMRDLVQRKFPADAILGEEFGQSRGSSGFAWIIDPIDGTKAFVHGVPLFGTLVAVTYQDQPVVGVCSLPALKETIHAAIGHGAWWNRQSRDSKARVSQTAKLSEALVCTTDANGDWSQYGHGRLYETLSQSTRLFRGWGDCYGHALVATGRADAMIDPILNPWDAAAFLPILAEAGGSFVDLDGNARFDGGHGVSVNAALRDELLATMAKHRQPTQSQPGT